MITYIFHEQFAARHRMIMTIMWVFDNNKCHTQQEVVNQQTLKSSNNNVKYFYSLGLEREITKYYTREMLIYIASLILM